MKIEIRRASENDLVEIQNLFVETVSEVCRKDYSADQLKVWTSAVQNKQQWQRRIENQYFILALAESNLVGFASLENSDYIDMLYVHKLYQRQGIANKLLQSLESEAVKHNITALTSDVSKTARPFFERNKFYLIAEQTKIMQGVEISNYKMKKLLA